MALNPTNAGHTLPSTTCLPAIWTHFPKTLDRIISSDLGGHAFVQIVNGKLAPMIDFDLKDGRSRFSSNYYLWTT
ncbi:uncharacterized protein CIMG_01947 [Coccidioides immitis RS]|uniref:Uncharacterized protein n=3 Tax=Coccidioides immitis TaxID=5501 RepID=J3KKA9_COCIM|nr:uncharacterized protein CIMG_01947 [Coccidioides immitis RS]EAS36593.3 hypothetical protein CIMG_01947 [Coccidioides immitis RS]KMP01959.1 hypothetical protein CIRG_02098 [Coccidioides immitis RMSCC 2394]KMU88145.1 hypothetical protein CIHG_05316 [Coccidioides immitis H538.4]